MLTKAVRDAWADALESGDYEQGQLYLEREGRFCCLGVLCVINGLTTLDGDTELGDITGYEAIDKELAFFPTDRGAFIHMNDNLGYSFTEIAAEVRKLPVRDEN